MGKKVRRLLTYSILAGHRRAVGIGLRKASLAWKEQSSASTLGQGLTTETRIRFASGRRRNPPTLGRCVRTPEREVCEIHQCQEVLGGPWGSLRPRILSKPKEFIFIFIQVLKTDDLSV